MSLTTSKRYGVILADPPWSYTNDNSGLEGVAGNHYKTMSLEDLCALPISDLAKRDAVLLMWATWPKLEEAAMPLIKAWGFRYVTGLPWVKLARPPSPTLFGDASIVPAWGVGYWLRGATEPILVAKRGNPKLPDDAPIGILCERMQHSRKPDNLYDYAEMLNGPYLELFARRARSGWDVYGNEVESTIQLEAHHDPA